MRHVEHSSEHSGSNHAARIEQVVHVAHDADGHLHEALVSDGLDDVRHDVRHDDDRVDDHEGDDVVDHDVVSSVGVPHGGAGSLKHPLMINKEYLVPS